MYKANEIAQWFINRAIQDAQNCGGEYLTNLKLHKLLYYAQGCSLATNNKALFKEDLYNWEHGPVVSAIYTKKSTTPFCEYIKINIDEKTEGLLQEVYKVFGKFSAWALREMTHREDPWKNTKRNEIIPQSLIKEYFIREVVTD